MRETISKPSAGTALLSAFPRSPNQTLWHSVDTKFRVVDGEEEYDDHCVDCVTQSGHDGVLYLG